MATSLYPLWYILLIRQSSHLLVLCPFSSSYTSAALTSAVTASKNASWKLWTSRRIPHFLSQAKSNNKTDIFDSVMNCIHMKKVISVKNEKGKEVSTCADKFTRPCKSCQFLKTQVLEMSDPWGCHMVWRQGKELRCPVWRLTLLMLNKLRCHTHF